MSSSWAAFERAGWEACVDPYHRFLEPVGAAVAPRLLELARVRAGADVLDLCCGPGYVAREAVALAARAHGVDISAGMVGLAGRLVPSGQFLVGDAEELPYASRSFDAVVCNFGLHHLPHPERAVAECARVLRPGGRFVSSVWDEEINDLAIVPEAIYGAGPIVPEEIPAPPPQSSYLEEKDAQALLAGCDLELVTTDVVEVAAAFASLEDLWSGWLAAAIRTGPVFAAQTPAVKKRARAAFQHSVSKLVAQDGSVQTRIRVVALIAERRG